MWVIHLFHNGRILALILSATLLGLVPSSSVALSLTFEGLTDGEAVQSQYALQGAVFNGAYAAISADQGGSLNQIDFPPTSNYTVVTNVPLDDALPIAGMMTVTFSTPLSRVEGYFAYSDTDPSASNGSNLVVSAYSFLNPTALVNQFSFSENLGSPLLVQLSGLETIGSLKITGEDGSVFTLDDLVGDKASGLTVPEPDTLWLFLGGLVGLLRYRRLARFF